MFETDLYNAKNISLTIEFTGFTLIVVADRIDNFTQLRQSVGLLRAVPRLRALTPLSEMEILCR